MVSKEDYLKAAHQTSVTKLSDQAALALAEEAYRTMRETGYHPKNAQLVKKIIIHANDLAKWRLTKRRVEASNLAKRRKRRNAGRR